MKNIQIIDAGENCTFSLFQATDEEFALLFPEPRQDIQYTEDLDHEQEEIAAAPRQTFPVPLASRGRLLFETTTLPKLSVVISNRERVVSRPQGGAHRWRTG